MDSVSLVVSSQKKNFQFWVWGSLGGASQVGVFSYFYGLLCTALDAHLMDPRFGPSIFMKLARAKLGGCQEGPLPPQNFVWPPSGPPKFSA